MSLQTLGQLIATSYRDQKLAHALVIQTLDFAKTQHQLTEMTRFMLCSQPDYINGVGCGTCKHCQLVQAGSHPDLSTITDVNGSIGIDEIRLVSNKLTKKSQLAQVQIVVIENAQNMTENAANALLKTLEEPSNNCFLILVTAGYVKLMPTILSRCQQITQPLLSKASLKDAYPELPDYLIGFADQNESFLATLAVSERLEVFNDCYQKFILWLKRQCSSSDLMNTLKDDELIDFFIYLIERRTRQILLKGHAQAARTAQHCISEFIFARRQVKGHNKNLALNAFLQNLEGIVR